MQFSGKLSATSFLADYWQRRPLFMPGGLPSGLPRLSADELGWLATLADVESRLIFTKHGQAGCDYRIEHGPFSEEQLAALPETDWTLLVQDVEKHLPELRAWFDCVDFIADWRIDDLMVSFAAPGGSAGPHRDNYDVFLCQGQGTREWRLADAAAGIPEAAHEEALLLAPFTPDVRHCAAEGDVLYLPPGVPHWGIADTACMTYSIGMRAPTQSELQCGLERLFPERPLMTTAAATRGQAVFADPDRLPSECPRGGISEQDLARVRRAFPALASLPGQELAVVLGSVATDPKAWLAPDPPDRAAAKKLLQQTALAPGLAVHGMARLAWCAGEDSALAFANGYHRALSVGELGLMQDLCGQRRLYLPQASGTDDARSPSGLCRWLIRHGAFDNPDNA